jgi:sulfide:quinone oxidoreductase
VARLHGETLGRRYEGEGNCYIEFGSGRVAQIRANFLGGPSPVATVVGPSEELAAEKAEFGATRRARWFGTTRA